MKLLVQDRINLFFESNPVIVTFQGNAEDLVISAPVIRNLDSGDKFNQMPNITVKTKSGNAISAKVDVLKQEGLFPSGNVLNDLAEYNASGAAASVSKFAATTVASSVAVAPAGNAKANKGKVVVQGENVAEQQLQYWFQQADKETQTRFLNWAKSINNDRTLYNKSEPCCSLFYFDKDLK